MMMMMMMNIGAKQKEYKIEDNNIKIKRKL